MAGEVNCTRNASPYWDLTIYDPSKSIDEGMTGGAVLPTKGGIAANILRKVDSIEFHDLHGIQARRGMPGVYLKNSGNVLVNNCQIIFKALSLEEAESQLFQPMVGLNLHLGWYDWWSFKKSQDTVFTGIVKSLAWTYESVGITCTMNLLEMQNIALYQQIPKPLFDGKEKNLRDALTKIADACKLKLAYNITDDTVKKYAKSDQCGKDKPWLGCTQTYVNIYTGKRDPITPKDVLIYLGDILGQAVTIRMGYLYFGTYDPFDKKINKLFDYRSEHRSFINQFNHLGTEPFESVEIIDNATQSSSVAGAVNIDMDSKKIANTKAESKTNIVKAHKIREVYRGPLTSNAVAIASQNIADFYKNRGYLTQDNETKKIDTTKAKDSPLPFNLPANSKDEQKAMLAGQASKASGSMLTIAIRGALGDPDFSAGMPFTFHGIRTIHTGAYTASEVIHKWSAKGTYKMDIIGKKDDGSGGSYMGPTLTDNKAKADADAYALKNNPQKIQIRVDHRGDILKELKKMGT